MEYWPLYPANLFCHMEKWFCHMANQPSQLEKRLIHVEIALRWMANDVCHQAGRLCHVAGTFRQTALDNDFILALNMLQK
jgi:hypothetical protein